MESEAADLMTRQALKVTEGAINITAASAKHLAAFVAALAKQPNKLIGKTSAKLILRESEEKNRPLAIFQLKEEDLKSFAKEAKRLGVSFTAMRDKNNPGVLDVLSFMDQAPLTNRIFEKMGYAVPEEAKQEGKATETGKNARNRRSQSKDESREQKTTSRPNWKKTNDEKSNNGKSSVKKKVEKFKKDQRHSAKPKPKEKDKGR